MSTPAGWHQQPDGRERYWDGQQWTDQFREGSVSAPPPPAPTKKSGGCLKWGLIAVAAVVLLGILAALLSGGDEEAATSGSTGTSQTTPASEETSEEASEEPSEEPTQEVDPDDAGDESNPVEIVEGQAFDIRGFAYSEGWAIGEEFDMITIEDLKVTNNRGERDSALVTINFMQGTEVLASVDCTSDPIQPGTTVTLSCFSADELPSSYDRITINDMF